MAASLRSDNWDEGNNEGVTVIPNCYCPNCGGGRATTTMLPTSIPLFRDIIIMTLCCEQCNFRNSEVNFSGEIQERGDKITLKLTTRDDLNRQLIKSDSASLLLPKLDFEIPPNTQRGSVSTIEGVLRKATENLERGQAERLKLGDIDNFYRCRKVIQNLNIILGIDSPDDKPNDNYDEDEDEDEDTQHQSINNSFEPFDIILDDPAGNSFIENPHAPAYDPHLHHARYHRTANQDMSLGLQPSVEAVKVGKIDDANPAHKNILNAPVGTHSLAIESTKERVSNASSRKETELSQSISRNEVIKFSTECPSPSCHAKTETNMCTIDIPHFKEVVIMSMLCERCGYKSNEIKGGGAIPKFGTEVEVKVKTADDLAREVLKSDTAGVKVPELGLELDEGGLDGLYTTVEGLLTKMHARLLDANPFHSGDAATKHHLSNDGGDFCGPSAKHVRYFDFLQRLKDMAAGRILPFSLIICDPLSNSFVGPVPKEAIALAEKAEVDGNFKCYNSFVDPNVTIKEYERSDEENEMLGLNDIKTENYQGEITRPEREKYYGTDQMDDLSDRLRRLDRHGPDHPLNIVKPVDDNTTIRGRKEADYTIPGMAVRTQCDEATSQERLG